jgi:hypothetical protein
MPATTVLRVAARPAILAFLATLALAAVALGLPWAAKDRELVASVPVAPDLFRIALVDLAPGATACTAPVVFDRRSARARFAVRAPHGAVLRVAAQGSVTGVARVPATQGTSTISVPVTSPDSPVAGALCIANGGRAAVRLEASGSPRRARTTVDGRPARAAVAIALLERSPAPLASRLGDVARRIGAFRPGIVGNVSVVLLGAVLAALLAAGLPWALGRGLRRDG